jgi:rhodanese-related sulfurtransferase
LKGQPFVPSYFGFDVDTNKSGPGNYEAHTGAVPFLHKAEKVEDGITIIDVRPEDKFKANHIEGSINIMARTPGEKMETWLGAVVQPEEPFYLVIGTAVDRDRILGRVAKIGYEKQIKAIITLADKKFATSEEMDYPDFAANPDAYTIVDIRNRNEVSEGKFFDQAIDIPLNELRERSGEIPTDKPVMVHCAGGYRSATGSSIIAKNLKGTTVFDLGDKVKEYNKPVSA